MTKKVLTILQVSPSDVAGGAERSARNLHKSYLKSGHDSWLAVGKKGEADPKVFELDNDAYRNSWVRMWIRVLEAYESKSMRIGGIGRMIRVLRDLGQPMRSIRRELGFDDFDYPGTRNMTNLCTNPPDIIHCHNLHGNYFDLTVLPELSRQAPVVLNLRDAWLLSGHCALPFECERWLTGCGQCPDLNLFPSIKRDGTSHNWAKKSALFKNSRLFVATPSQWLMDRVNQSMISPAIIESRVIPNGVNTEIFCLGDKAAARAKLGIAADAVVLLTAANGIKENVWKDYKMLKQAISMLARREDRRKITLVAVGDSSPNDEIDGIAVHFVPFVSEQASMSLYYQAADVYLHTARVETFGNVLLEARACGTPIVSTAVGGIPEHVRSLAWDQLHDVSPSFALKDATGILTRPADSEAFSGAVSFLIDHHEIRAQLGRNGCQDVVARFSLESQAACFLDWYNEILSGKTTN